MKKIALLLISGLMFTSCSDLLDTDPYDQFTKTNFFTSEKNVQLFINYTYNEFSGYGNGGGYGDFYFNVLNDDQGTTGITEWTFTAVPATASAWNSPYAEIRRANTLLAALPGISEMTPATKANYEDCGHALYRAWQHFKLVRSDGDCYWVDKVLDTNETDILYGARQNRNTVMDKVLEDLNYACANINQEENSRVAYNKYVALAMKSRVCLFEGTYSKYVLKDEARANAYLNECKNASLEIMTSGKYELNADFKSNFDQLDLKGNPEMIMYKHYVYNVLGHGTVDYTCGSTQVHGMSKDAFDSYLFRDGKPQKQPPLATRAKTVNSVKIDDQSGFGEASFINIADLLKQRDPRLTAQVDSILQFPGCGYARFGGAQSTSSTGYGVLLFDTSDAAASTVNQSVLTPPTLLSSGWLKSTSTMQKHVQNLATLPKTTSTFLSTSSATALRCLTSQQLLKLTQLTTWV